MTLASIIATSIRWVGDIAGYLILARILLSLFNLSPSNPIANFLYSVTEPILGPIRGLLNRIFKRPMMLDFSPIIAFFLIDYVIVPLLISLVYVIFK